MAYVIDMDIQEEPLENAVAQALGAASVCWENPGGAGQFYPDMALDVYQQLMDRIEKELRKEKE